MAARKIIIGLDSTLNDRVALRFALDFFNEKKNMIVFIMKRDDNGELPFKINNLEDQLSIRLMLENSFDFKDQIKAKLVLKELPERTDVLMYLCQYADLFLCSRESYQHTFRYYFGAKEDLPEMAEKTCCPKILIPEHYQNIGNVVLVHDQSPASLFAIKQFCRFFHEHCINKEIVLFTLVDEAYHTDQEEDFKLLITYLKQHCKKLGVFYFNGEPSNQIKSTLELKDNTLIVSRKGKHKILNQLFTDEDVVQIMDVASM